MLFYEDLKLNLQDQNEKDFFQLPAMKSILLPLHLTIITKQFINVLRCFIFSLIVLLEKVKNLKAKILFVLINFKD